MSDQYYRFFPGDYIRDTQRLSLLEHGAYRVLLDSYYCEEFLPSDRESLYHICRAFKKDEKKAVDVIVERYFKENGENNRLLNKKAEEEIKSRRLFLEQQNRKSKLGVEARRQSIPTENQEPTGQPTGQPEGEPNHLHHHKKIYKSLTTLCPQQEIVDLWGEVFPEMSKPLDWGSDRQALLRTRWNESFQGEDRKSIEWWRKFFLYIRDCPFLMGDIDPPPGRRRFRLKLEWIIIRKNFRKIFEGDYAK